MMNTKNKIFIQADCKDIDIYTNSLGDYCLMQDGQIVTIDRHGMEDFIAELHKVRFAFYGEV